MSLIGPIDHEVVPPDRTLFTYKTINGDIVQTTWNEYQDALAMGLVDTTGISDANAMQINDIAPGIETTTYIPGVMPDGFSNL
jgi:hypothetical protein